MLCAPLDWQYAELPSSASDAVCELCLYVRFGSSDQIKLKKKKIKKNNTLPDTRMLKYRAVNRKNIIDSLHNYEYFTWNLHVPYIF